MIRKFIKEELGKQLEIYNISEYITDYLAKTIQEEQENINDGEMHRATFPIRRTENIIRETKINFIEIDFYYIKKETFKISGSFKSNETRLADNGNYNVVMEIKIENDDRNIEVLKENIESVVSHELNHAFVFIKKINRQSKSNVYNSARKITEFGILNFPELQEFMTMFYLAIPEEIQARVQETGTLLKKIKANNSDEAVRELYLYQPINDAKRMVQYTNDNIESLDRNLLQNFINAFNGNVDFQSKGIDVKKINNIDKFFKYWIDEINYNGYKLNLKILKLVSDKFNKEDKLKNKENDRAYLGEFCDSGFMDEILGERF